MMAFGNAWIPSVTMSCWRHCGQKVRLGPFNFPMRVLITGGLGFVGGRLAVHLAKAGHSVVLGSRKAIAPPDWLSRAEVVQIHWGDRAALERSCEGVDVVIHAAGMNAQDCATNPVAALAFNGIATAQLVDAACRTGVQSFIYLSTAHVYASPLVGTITEKTCPRNLHPYATSHLAGENAVLYAGDRRLIQSIVLRLSNAFGAPTHEGVNCWKLLVNDLCRQAVQTGNLVLYTSGQQQRDFIPMTAVCHVLERLIIGTGVRDSPCGIFNVGAGTSQSVLAMTQTIRQRCLHLLGFEPSLRYKNNLTAESHGPLNYRVAGLEKLAMDHDGTQIVAEVDQLLRYCAVVFGRI
jgi:UDP-glucose 4-epimerase